MNHTHETTLIAPHATDILPAAATPSPEDWRDRMIERLMQADRSPMELAEEFGVTLPQLAEWAADARHMLVLEHLARLADVRALLLVSQYRATAAAQLIQIAAKEASELSRKACVDLLKVRLNPFKSGTSHDTSEEETLDQAAVLAALERIGAQHPGGIHHAHAHE